MPLVHNDSIGLSLYARFDNAGNTAIDFAEGASLKQGRYEILDSAIVSASVVAGDYAVRVMVGTAATQAAIDELRGVISFSWNGTTEITLRSINTDIANVSGKLPSALVGGRIDASVGAMAANSLTNSAIANDAFTANKFHADVTTELQNGLSTLDAAGIRAAVGLVAANLDTQLTNIQNDTNDIQTTLAGFGGGGLAGPGADEVTLIFEETGSGDPIADADVWITTDAAGDNVIAGTIQTNSNGEVVFLLDDGATYFRWMQKDGVEAVMGEQFVAVAD